MKVILLIVFLIGLYAVGTNGFVVGTPGVTSTYNKEIRAESLVTNIVLKSIRNSDGSYVTFSADYCDGNLNSLNLFTPPTGPVLVVFCDQNGEPQILGAPVSNALYTTVDVGTDTSIFDPYIPDRSLSSICYDISNDYEPASALDLLLIVDHAKAYRGLGYEEYFLTNDLSGFASRSYHINIYNTSESFPQFNIPAKNLNTASQYLQDPTTPSTWNANVACRHVDAPIKFVSTQTNYGVDLLSDYYGEFRAINEDFVSEVVNRGLFPATMTLQDKDGYCRDYAGPDYHAATAAQVRMFLKNSVNPTASILTNVYASSDCLGSSSTDFYSLVSNPWGSLTGADQKTVSDNNLYDYGVRCQPVAFVTADSCEPLTAVSNPPTTSVYYLDDANGVDYPNSDTFTGLPTIRRAQEVMDWCIGATTACNPATNCLQNASLIVSPCGTAGAQADSLVNSVSGTWDVNPSARRALFGHLACTNLPLGRRPAYPTCNVDQPVVCSSTTPPASGVTPTVVTAPNTPFTVTVTNQNVSYVTADGTNVAVLTNAFAFRFEPRQDFDISSFTLEFSFQNAASRTVLVRGCGYDDDCFNYSDFAQDIPITGINSSTFVDTVQSQCYPLIVVGGNVVGETVSVDVNVIFS